LSQRRQLKQDKDDHESYRIVQRINANKSHSDTELYHFTDGNSWGNGTVKRLPSELHQRAESSHRRLTDDWVRADRQTDSLQCSQLQEKERKGRVFI